MKTIKTLSLIALVVLILAGCRSEVQSFTILRQPLITFQTDTFSTISATNSTFSGGATSVHTYPDNTQQLLRRYVLESIGRNQLGQDFWLQMEVDIVTNGQFIGVYRPTYDRTIGGLNDVRYRVRQAGRFVEYGLAPGSNAAYVQVERQNVDERLIRGIFAATLVNLTDTTQPDIELFTGTFVDITYAL